jgi:hypothetical protein
VRAVLAVGAGRGITAGTWIASHVITIRASLTSPLHVQSVAVQVEVVPRAQRFLGRATATSGSVAAVAGRLSLVRVSVGNLRNGTWYRWRVRTVAAGGQTSRWSQGGTFAVNTRPPAQPALRSTNVPLNAWSAVKTPVLTWITPAGDAPVTGYQYAVLSSSQVQRHVAPAWHTITGHILALPHWRAGHWHVYVRALDAAGNRSRPTPWAFSLARIAPPPPLVIASMPRNGATSNARTVTLRLAPRLGQAPLRAYQYAVTRAAGRSRITRWTLLKTGILRLSSLPTGRYHVWVRSQDAAGLVSQPLQWSFIVDRVPPRLSKPVLSAQSFTAGVQKITLDFKVSKPSRVVWEVVQAGHARPIRVVQVTKRATGATTISWNGRLASGHFAPAGQYALQVSATDRAGNTAIMHSGAFQVFTKRIYISISKEALWAYDGDHLVLQSLVTNGGPETPTVPGIFYIEEKLRDWVFHSPWPHGSPLWYPDSPTNFDLLYDAAGGYFIHDAPWRTNYGPGSNSVDGTPGGDYTGSHGCTNVPYDAMQALYNWADVGTLIQIVP